MSSILLLLPNQPPRVPLSMPRRYRQNAILVYSSPLILVLQKELLDRSPILRDVGWGIQLGVCETFPAWTRLQN